MIVWCGRCDTRTVDITTDDLFAIRWFGHTAERPWCEWCIIWAVIQWPRIGFGVPMAEPLAPDTNHGGDRILGRYA